MNDEMDAAMKAVVEDMGRAARAAKAKKYAPKPPPAPPVVEAAPEEPGPSADELAALLGDGA